MQKSYLLMLPLIQFLLCLNLPSCIQKEKQTKQKQQTNTFRIYHISNDLNQNVMWFILPQSTLALDAFFLFPGRSLALLRQVTHCHELNW